MPKSEQAIDWERAPAIEWWKSNLHALIHISWLWLGISDQMIVINDMITADHLCGDEDYIYLCQNDFGVCTRWLPWRLINRMLNRFPWITALSLISAWPFFFNTQMHYLPIININYYWCCNKFVIACYQQYKLNVISVGEPVLQISKHY